MNPAFVAPTALPARPASARTAAVSPARPARAAVSMSAGGEKKQSLTDWLLGKFMHNAIWDGDQEAGYEPFFKEAMEARDDQKKKAYEEQQQKSS